MAPRRPTTTPTRCRSVGWLIHDGRDAKVVAPHIGDEDHGELQRNGEMTIPACAIKRMRRIRWSLLAFLRPF
jgi:hypothetical protein